MFLTKLRPYCTLLIKLARFSTKARGLLPSNLHLESDWSEYQAPLLHSPMLERTWKESRACLPSLHTLERAWREPRVERFWKESEALLSLRVLREKLDRAKK